MKLFTDGADKAQIVEMAKQPHIAGFTTNPSLLRKAGVTDYESYARDLVAAALAGLDAGEVVTIPSLPDPADWQAFEAARFHLGPNLSRRVPAARYGLG